ncbi:flavin-dependent monooxygenase QhpG [Tahibacter soli]|uniref:Tryptophan 7-halogenase n=1 Tax=Tahibacter soli TaxID=2983605 RepID=A0A9X3YT74_9GAMM|nr:FAD-dependent monooxygenase [Tahibacter soli]MDC8015991.1 tryptophan 7-halogenase [Tahibacter soli]
MNAALAVDALIVGAGPAGLTAALRLAQFGYRTAVVERNAAPRGNVGESLTPGIGNIVGLLDANDALARVPRRAGLAARVAWTSRDAVFHAGGNAIVDRAAFDGALFDLARERGVRCFASAQVAVLERDGEHWRAVVQTGAAHERIVAHTVFDAGGRPPAGRDGVVATAPPLVALWLDYDGALAPAETRIEALTDAWLWGSPLPDGRYRAMALCDPDTPRHAQARSREMWLRTTFAASGLMTALATAPAVTALNGCAAGACLVRDAWQPGRVRLGDAAFALDPLSASGVEKAMRFSLQAVTAFHTSMRHPERAALARTFYDARRVESIARHGRWARDYYAQAWPAREHAFWQAQAAPFAWPDAEAPPADEREPVPDAALAPTDVDAALRAKITLARESRLVELPCVVDDVVELRAALDHPALARPLAWLSGVELAPLLAGIADAANLAQLIERWSQRMPRREAARIAGWLLQKGIVHAG